MKSGPELNQLELLMALQILLFYGIKPKTGDIDNL